MPCSCEASFSPIRNATGPSLETLQAGLLFIVLASPHTFQLVQHLLGRFLRISHGGVPTAAGLLLHAAVFAVMYKLIRRRRADR